MAMSPPPSQASCQVHIRKNWTNCFFDTPPSSIALVMVILSLPLLYGLSSVPALCNTKGKILSRWRKHWDSFKHFTPFILPTDKRAIRSYTVDLGIVTLTTLLSRVTNFLIPMLLRMIVDRLADDDASLPTKEIVAFVLLRQVVSEAVTSLHWTILIRVENDVSNRLMCHLYDRVLTLSADYHDSKRPLDTYGTISSGGPRFSRFAGSIFFDKIPSLIDLVVAIVAFWRFFGGMLAVTMAAISLVFVWASAKLGPRRHNDFVKALRLRRERDDLGSDTLRNWHTVAGFNNIVYEEGRYLAATERSTVVGEKYGISARLLSSQKDLIMAAGLVIMSLLASVQIKTGTSRSVGDFVMLLQYWNDLAFPIQNFVHWMTWLDEFFVESDKIIDIMTAEPTVTDREDAVEFQLGKGDIEFERVGFSYDGKLPAVSDVSFKIGGGKTVAIVGETGGGKSTLLKLLCRSYDATEGTIRVDGQDVRHVRLASLMKHISIVPQSIGVFNTTILENLKYGNLAATHEDCMAACETAVFHTKIMSFPGKYDEKVGEKGTKLSGGELQRLAIARLLLRDSRILLFDEALSSLDSETEWKIQESLRKWCVDKTVIIVAHRLATVAHADLILAVKDGAIVESGRQEELLEKGGYYYQLWDKQRLK